MTASLKPGILLFCAALLAGCGNRQDGNDTKGALTGMFQGLKARIIGAAAQEDTGVQPVSLTPEQYQQLAASHGVIFTIPAFNTRIAAVPVAVNAGKVTRMAESISVTTQGGGFLIAARGLPEDLLSTEVSGFGAALSSSGSYSRIMEWPAERDGTRQSEFTCTISNDGNERISVAGRSSNATLYSDRCVGQYVQFINKYWIDSGNRLLKSNQWVSQSVGYLQIEHIF